MSMKNERDTTPNYGLVKPKQTDFYNIDDFNENMGKIDGQIKVNAEGIQQNSTQIKDLSDKVENIDISWEGITGKPPTFPPSTHNHLAATQSANGFMTGADKTKLDGITVGANNYVHPTTTGNKHIPSGGAAGQFLKYSSDGTAAWVTPTKGDVGLGSVQNYGIATATQCEAATANNLYVTPAGLANLKQSVVNGKQEVVNAINDKLGYTSGLTTSNTHSEYAWWIINKIEAVKSKLEVYRRLVFDPAIKDYNGRLVGLNRSITVSVKDTVPNVNTFNVNPGFMMPYQRGNVGYISPVDSQKVKKYSCVDSNYDAYEILEPTQFKFIKASNIGSGSTTFSWIDVVGINAIIY